MMRRFLVLILVFFLSMGCSAEYKEQSPEEMIDEASSVEKNLSGESLSQGAAKTDSLKKSQPIPKKPTIKQDAKQEVKQEKKRILLDVPLIKQNPELKYGCEVTSLTMLLQYAGVKVNKIQLADRLPKDKERIEKSKTGDIIRWGDPDEGFVGDITGKQAGYAVFDKPVEELMNRYLGERVVNLTNQPFDKLLAQIKKGRPVLVWTTGDYRLPDRWESWKHGKEQIKTPLDLHAVVLVGYDENYVYVNDPLSGVKAQKVNKQTFISSWKALKKRALSYN